MNDGRLTSQRLTQLYIDRIFALDQNGPAVNSVIELNLDAIEMAERADAMRRRGATSAKFPLLGIPLLFKDNIDTGDHMQTTAGSFALAGLPALQDSTVAAKLRAAGAVILGKTNLSEWANFRSTHSTSGWSGRGGLTHNPFSLDRNACGSSSGSGAADVRELRGDLLRQRDRWQHRLSRQRQRGRRVQADDWPGEPHRRRTHLAHSGHGGPARTHTGRCRDGAERDRQPRSRSARPGNQRRSARLAGVQSGLQWNPAAREEPACPSRRLHGIPEFEWPQRGAPGPDETGHSIRSATGCGRVQRNCRCHQECRCDHRGSR